MSDKNWTEQKDLSEKASELMTWANLIVRVSEANRFLPQAEPYRPARDLLPILQRHYVDACRAFGGELGVEIQAPVPDLLRPPPPPAAPQLTPYVGPDGRTATAPAPIPGAIPNPVTGHIT
jgi:hypothetical protein